MYGKPKPPIERKLHRLAGLLSLCVWIAAIALPSFGVLSWWIAIPIALVWQYTHAFIFLGIIKQMVLPEKFAEILEKIKRGEPP
jgi:hypothetical protein